MALTQLKTGAIADDAVTTDKLANAINTERTANTAKVSLDADSVTGAKIADDAIDSEHYTDGSIDTAHIADLNVTTAKIAADAVTGAKIADDAVGAEHIEVLDASLQLGDSVKAEFGAGDDLEIYHDGSHSWIKNATGRLILQTDGDQLQLRGDSVKFFDGDAAETLLEAKLNGSVDLYYDDSKTFETVSGGTKTTGGHTITSYSGTAGLGQLNFGASGTPNIKAWDTGNHGSGSKLLIRSGDGDTHIECNRDGNVELYHDNSEKLRTTSDGVIVTGGIYLDGSGGGAAANKLDDYEEGSFTPTVSSGVSAIGYATQGGRYTKIGDTVHFTLLVRINSATLNSDSFKFGGLPFTSANDTERAGGAFIHQSSGNFGTTNTYRVSANSTEILVFSSAGDAVAGTSTSFNTTNRMIAFTGFYFV